MKTMKSLQNKSFRPVLTEELESIKQQIELLSNYEVGVIVEATGIALDDMTKEEKLFQLKKKYVTKVHITKTGEERRINAPDPSKSGPLRAWNTLMPTGSRICRATESELIDALYDFYGGGKTKLRSYKFCNVFPLALASHAARGKSKDKKTIEQKTVEEYEKTYKRFVNPELANADVRDVDLEYLDGYLYDLLQEAFDNGKPVKERAFTNAKTMFNMVFDYCVREKLMSGNPSRSLKPSDYSKLLDYSTHSRNRSDIMHTQEDMQRLFAEADKRAKHPQFHGFYNYNYMMKVQDILGTRPGELVVLKWKNLDRACGILKICEQQRIYKGDKKNNVPTTYKTIPYTKNERKSHKGGREFPVCDELMALFDEIKGMQEAHGIESEYIFCDPSGDPVKKDLYISYLGRLCKDLGIKGKGTYVFRRDANCRLAHGGTDEINRGKLLGNSCGVNNSCYTYEEEDHISKARDILEASSFAWNTVSNTQITPAKIIVFPNEKSPRTANSKAFHKK